jgi:hypothetical protein
VRGSGVAAGNGRGNEGDVGEMDGRTKMILLSLIPALSGGGGEQGNTTNGVLLNALGAIDLGSGAGSSNTAEAGSPNPALVNALKEFISRRLWASIVPQVRRHSMLTPIRLRRALDHARIRALPMQQAKAKTRS